MSMLNSLPGRALDLAGSVGDSIRQAVPGSAIKWLETGAALGTLKTGTRIASKFVRRNPAIAVAAAAGAGLLWYVARRQAKKAQANGTIEGSATRIDAKRASSTARKPRARKTTSAR
ncbi:MAG: hypothetical protein M3Q13_03780 [Pseudomonadota bacterium]|nr:hypothetical protein [Pseudomonadota bacterium]